MTDATQYAENQFADMWFNNTAPDGAVDGPSVALWTTTPANAPDAANEVAGDSYSRIATVSADWNETSAGGPTTYENGVELDFGVLDTGTSTTVEGVVLVREDLTDDQFIYANGDVSETVDAGNEFKINAGDATFSID